MKYGHEIDQLSQLPEFRNAASFGWVSQSSYMLGQNDGFSDGFLTKIHVVTSHSGQLGKSNDPVKSMKSIDYTTSVGFLPIRHSSLPAEATNGKPLVAGEGCEECPS
jgi:hypothetical protein